MKKSLSIILLSLLFVACGGNHRYTALMQQADSLLTADNATAAYRLLAAADTQKTAWHRSQRMAYELLKAEAQNKAYIDFKTDSILRPVAQYYDSHGTSNQRLRAHYILGCAYRDMKEAPLAIITWETAIDCADTTAADCDFATLFRVYGQMADFKAESGRHDKCATRQRYSQILPLSIHGQQKKRGKGTRQTCNKTKLNL